MRGDRDLLVQLFANLVENAIRHCPPGARIALALHDEPGGFRAELSDDGLERARRLHDQDRRIRSTDAAKHELTLSSGETFTVDSHVKLGSFKTGDKVAVTYDTKDGKKLASKVKQAK